MKAEIISLHASLRMIALLRDEVVSWYLSWSIKRLSAHTLLSTMYDTHPLMQYLDCTSVNVLLSSSRVKKLCIIHKK